MVNTRTRSQSNSCLASLTFWEHAEDICLWSGRQTHPSIIERELEAQRVTVTFTRSQSRRVAESALPIGSTWPQSLYPPHPYLPQVGLSALLKPFQVQNNSISPGQCANTFENNGFLFPLQSAQCPWPSVETQKHSLVVLFLISWDTTSLYGSG